MPANILNAQMDTKKPVVSVLTVINREKNANLDVLCSTITRTIRFTLSLMDKHRVIKDDYALASADQIEVREYAENNGIDNVIFGEMLKDDASNVVINMSVYDRFEDRVTITEKAIAESIFDIFNAADELVIALLEGFSGVHVAYGTIRIVNRGEDGSFTIYINNEPAGENAFSIAKVFIGNYRLRIVQDRLFVPYELFNDDIRMKEDAIYQVPISIPYLTEKEANEFHRIDRIVQRNWHSSEGENLVTSAFAEALSKVEGLSSCTGFVDMHKKYERWQKSFMMRQAKKPAPKGRSIDLSQQKTVWESDYSATLLTSSNTTGDLHPKLKGMLTWRKVGDLRLFDRNHGAASVVYKDKMWIIGGLDTSSVWFSEDGKKWNTATVSAAFGRRANHEAVIFRDKIWVIGGRSRDPNIRKHSIYLSDIWASEDGENWEPVTKSAPFGPLREFACLVYDSKLWVFGHKRDVWYSEDGETWKTATKSAPFEGQTTGVVYKNRIWIIQDEKNNVWSSEDGIHWKLATSSAPFGNIDRHGWVAYKDKMWIIGGQEIRGGSRRPMSNDVWYSDDGKTWKMPERVSTIFKPRGWFSCFSFENKLWVVSGHIWHPVEFEYLDIWCAE